MLAALCLWGFARAGAAALMLVTSPGHAPSLRI